MSRISGANTGLEVKVRQYLFKKGLRYKLHYNLKGKPDIAFPGKKTLIFVHGCFWHPHDSCKLSVTPKKHRSFWTKKLKGNKARDRKNTVHLRKLGWKVLTVRECELTKNSNRVLRKLYENITQNNTNSAILIKKSANNKKV